MTIPNEPRPGTVYLGRFFIALARNGAGFLADASHARKGVRWTADPLQALRIPDRAFFTTLCERAEYKAAEFKLIACTDEIHVGPKPKPPPAPAPPAKKKPKRKGAPDGGQLALDP